MLRAALACLLALGLSACSGQELSPSSAPTPAKVRTTAPSPAPATTPAPTRPALTGRYDEYVALGDSYTAGPLIAPEDPAGESCGRSLANYPHLLADLLEVDTLRDVSCSGASTQHLTRRQSNIFGSNPPQLRALSAGTDLVTLGIGGNDFNVFGRLISGCAQARATDPDGSPCSRALSGVGAVLDRTSERVRQALEEIQHRSPDAEVLLVGYPRLVPATGHCPDVLPFADGDYAFAAGVERRLNDTLRRAARAAGVDFVDVAAASKGHDACAGEQAWVNGRRTVRGRALSYHPFEREMAAVTRLIYAELG